MLYLKTHIKSYIIIEIYKKCCQSLYLTRSSAIAERPRCMVGQVWPKVEDDILQTVGLSSTTVT